MVEAISANQLNRLQLSSSRTKDQIGRENYMRQISRHPSAPLSLSSYLASFSGQSEYGRLYKHGEYAGEEPHAARAVNLLTDLNHGRPTRANLLEADTVLGYVIHKAGEEYARRWYGPHHMRLLLAGNPTREKFDPAWRAFLQADQIRTTLEDRGIFDPETDRFSWAAIAAFSVLSGSDDPFLPLEVVLRKIPAELRRPYFRNEERIADISQAIDRFRAVGLLPSPTARSIHIERTSVPSRRLPSRRIHRNAAIPNTFAV